MVQRRCRLSAYTSIYHWWSDCCTHTCYHQEQCVEQVRKHLKTSSLHHGLTASGMNAATAKAISMIEFDAEAIVGSVVIAIKSATSSLVSCQCSRRCTCVACSSVEVRCLCSSFEPCAWYRSPSDCVAQAYILGILACSCNPWISDIVATISPSHNQRCCIDAMCTIVVIVDG